MFENSIKMMMMEYKEFFHQTSFPSGIHFLPYFLLLLLLLLCKKPLQKAKDTKQLYD